MYKKIYTLAGFPRAGNTLLSCILNQNPAVQATGHSFIPDIFYALSKVKKLPIYLNFPDSKSYNNVMKNIISNYYKDWNADYIIERGDWITPFNFDMFKRYSPNEIKIVILVRNIIDIIKSYLKICQNNPLFYINREYNSLDKTELYTDEIETKCDLIMKKNDYVDTAIYSIKWLVENNHLSDIYIVEYENLVNNPKETVQSICKFYGLPSFEYKFTDLQQLEVNDLMYNDKSLSAPIHTIRTDKIEKSVNEITLSPKIINKYSNLEFWRIHENMENKFKL
jgi:hypothetical protein